MIYLVGQPQPCPNTGDNAADPSRYFDLGGVRRVSYMDRIDDQDYTLVVGGGGIIQSEDVNSSLHRMIANARKAVIWGPGLQYPYARDMARYPDWIDGPKGWLLPEHRDKVLIGLRDAGTGVPWLPCVSCMDKAFDNPPSPSRSYVVYHGSRILPSHGHPEKRNNAGETIESVVAFLASAETIVTSSYHGLIWGCLLGRKVVMVPAMANAKFYHWPFSHVRVQSGVDWRAATPVPCRGALEICREANREFYQRVQRFLV